MTQYGFFFDMNRCYACQACSIACKDWNEIEPGAEKWMTVYEWESGTFPNLRLHSLAFSCAHCENPACVKVCPVGATYKDPETGVVRQDYDKCIGCRMCMSACPYTGVRSFNWDEPSYPVDFATGDADVPTHQKHVVEKCTMCWHRLAKDLAPACVEVCPARVRFFGDLDDPDSEVSQLIRDREYMQLLAEEGTKPSVYYLV